MDGSGLVQRTRVETITTLVLVDREGDSRSENRTVCRQDGKGCSMDPLHDDVLDYMEI